MLQTVIPCQGYTYVVMFLLFINWDECVRKVSYNQDNNFYTTKTLDGILTVSTYVSNIMLA